jgi:hypothetical protein
MHPPYWINRVFELVGYLKSQPLFHDGNKKGKGQKREKKVPFSFTSSAIISRKEKLKGII